MQKLLMLKNDEKSSGIGLSQDSKEEVAVLARCIPFDHLTKRLLVFPIEDVPYDSQVGLKYVQKL